MTTFDDVIHLRASIGRIAQCVGSDNELNVTGKSPQELALLAHDEPNGWDDLATRAYDKINCITDSLTNILSVTFDETEKLRAITPPYGNQSS